MSALLSALHYAPLLMPLTFAAWFAVTEWRDRRFRRGYAALVTRNATRWGSPR